MVKQNNILVMIPTYNESGNVASLARKLIDLNIPIDILFIDDNSTDRTGEILDNIKGYQGHATIHVIHRPGKMGVGSAHKDGIAYAYSNEYSCLITMDCDGTHDPNDIKYFIWAAFIFEKSCIIVGSRHLESGSLEGWCLWRRFVTHMGHILTTTMLRMPYDATGAFRLYKLDKIPQDAFMKVQRDDYAFFFESLMILNENRFKIYEIPIKLAARSAGQSKLKTFDLVFVLLYMLKLRYYIWFDKKRIIV